MLPLIEIKGQVAYIVRRDRVFQDVCEISKQPAGLLQSQCYLEPLKSDVGPPIEFSLEQSLHFCTMLALPLPPFSGTLSCERDE